MSIWSPLVALALLTSLGAHAGLVDVTRTAIAAQSEAPLGAVFACYRRAHDDTRLREGSIAELCRGADDARPVDCYLAGRNRAGLADDDAIALCRCASSTEPVACFEYGRQATTMDRKRILSLCAPAERFELDEACRPPSR